ncbi:MAG: pyridine nucleotide-disulfide oxidoreductase [Gammaproteobacteria bacterium RIFCSPHIGHO2_12_FULL_41_20]|nr:MAG: pyridine nucleotide-disulfide oxidoreductase [Gammaproteobacteria bacterium RIFCSPHIGHO2_12_FULL_41_20]
MPTPCLTLSGFTFEELLSAQGLARLDQTFLAYLEKQNPAAQKKLIDYRVETQCYSHLEESELLLTCAPILENFLIHLFNIGEPVALLRAQILSHNPIALFKKQFVLKHAKKKQAQATQFPTFNELTNWLNAQLQQAALQSTDQELAVALLAKHYLSQPEHYAEQTTKLIQWCTQALNTREGQEYVKSWVSFHIPERTDHTNLVPTISTNEEKIKRSMANVQHLRLRDGFKLTDPRMQPREIQNEVNYCIYCHDHEGDFCSKGFPVKKSDSSQGLKRNSLNALLTGCPLEEKISEMHILKRDGLSLAALAMIMVDNPMCPATGHRICNDCMKACIYQKQEPVNIPQIETSILTDILSLPWGVEIYDLLTRWNPLRKKQWVMSPYNGLKILIAGMGPAGFTLAHHLLMEGFAVVGIDGLKIEPLPQWLLSQPIYDFHTLKESLDERLMAGFGGVAEYGITVRWDKNFLKLIYLSLLRRPHFQVFGSVRFGGTLTIDDAWHMGFDHLAVAVGAGLPKALAIPGSLASGMRQANDFLMALQLGNAAKPSSLTNLQIRLPAVVIGGGLTGVDTATEIQAYYIAQVEKTLQRYAELTAFYGEDHVLSQLDSLSKEILEEALAHGRAVRKEREQAKANQRRPNFIKLLHEWGGVTIVYRRSMQESPAYINNHEELKKALEEGVYYAEALEPVAAELNQFGYTETLICHKRIRKNADEWEATVETVHIPARAIFVATGTQPNIAYEFEHRGTFTRLGLQYQHYEDVDGKLVIAHGVEHCKDTQFGPFTSYQKGHYRVSLIGDTHPVFHGSVVKAIASGMRTYPKILHILHHKLGNAGDWQEYRRFASYIDNQFQARITAITRRTKNVIELTIQAPLASKHFQPGQFYRLQNYETHALRVNQTLLQMEPLALIGADHDVNKGTLKFIIIESGASAKLCSTMHINEPVSLMGPTGVRCKITSSGETVLIIGNQLSIALLQSYGSALRAAGSRVIYLGYFSTREDIYCQHSLEKNADVIIWLIQQGNPLNSIRPQDYMVHGHDVIKTLLHYAKGQLNPHKLHPEIPLADVDRVYVIGNSSLLRHLQEIQKTLLKEVLTKNPRIFGSVYSNMQCMLKGVCAQCLQWQIDPETGKRTKAVFACSWPDQPLEVIDTDNIDARHIQNRMQEQLSDLWVEYLFAQHAVPRI